MTISTNKKIKLIQKYMKVKGWNDESLILKRIIEKTEGTEEAEELLSLVKKPSSLKVRDFFERFKDCAKNHPHLSVDSRIFEAWTAFETSLCCAPWFFKNTNKSK